jgi:hypothetical protein
MSASRQQIDMVSVRGDAGVAGGDVVVSVRRYAKGMPAVSFSAYRVPIDSMTKVTP